MPAMPPATPPVPSGLDLAPFHGLRYADADIAAVTAPPYDVIDDAARARLEARDEHNVVRLILPRDTDGAEGSRYREAARLLQHWTEVGVLARDDEAALYVYEESVEGHVQRGLLGALALAPFDAGIVLPHENTMAGVVADRLALMEATEADLEPIFLVYDGAGGAAASAVEKASADTPMAEATTEDGVTHRLWAITDPGTLEAVRADLLPRKAVIADGHHRYTTYLQRQAARHAAGDGPGPWDRGLVLLVDTSSFGPQVHAIHRVIAELALDDAVERARPGFSVSAVDDGEPDQLLAFLAGVPGHAFLLSDGTEHWLLHDPDPTRLDTALPPGRSDAWRGLDVSVAHHLLIRGLWGLDDGEQVVGFEHDAAAAMRAAAQADGTALLLNPTPVGAVSAVAAADDRMPRKSTLFTPKPRSGLVMRTYADS
ncbi:MAG: hypothetical protein QOJ92_975 [Frankiales bacterium]|nr:hypothetical protein [Frankiales bacterium]